MTLRRGLFSLKVTAVVLALILFLLILNVTIPQEHVLGPRVIHDIVEGRPVMNFFLITLGLAHVPTSPLFLTLLIFFYLQLLAFIVRFVTITWKRVRTTPGRWETWRSMEVKGPDTSSLTRELERRGFREARLKGGEIWYVRNRISPLGFLLFHISFLFLLTGGLLIHYTRFLATVDLVQDHTMTFSGRQWSRVHRRPLLMPPGQSFKVRLDTVEARRVRGEPVRLDAALTFGVWSGASREVASVNSPATFLGYAFYPQTVYDAYVFKVFDRMEFLVDTFGVQTKGDDFQLPSVALPDGCTLTVQPSGEGLARVEGPGFVETIPLSSGAVATTSTFSLHVADKVPWVSFKVVHERGGFLLIAGFILAVLGLVFRFLFPRQDLVVTPGTLFFRGDYFPHHLSETLQGLQRKHHDTS